MENTLNELARDLVGTRKSPFFVTLVNDVEFDGSPSTIAAFSSIEDAANFAEGLYLNANEMVAVEGPGGIYLELTQGSRISFMESGKLAITTQFGKAVVTAN